VKAANGRMEKLEDDHRAQEAAEEMLATVRRMKDIRVVVMGDPMQDWYHFGRVDRLSPEAPVPIFIQEREELSDGGAGNVVAQLRALNATVVPYFPPAPQSVKHRYMVGSQQLFRIDRDRDHSRQEGGGFNADGKVDAVVISDYGKGWCTHARCREFIDYAQRLKIPVVVDPKGKDWEKYSGATAICPNDKEFKEREAVLGWKPPMLLHKRGPEGMDLVIDGGSAHFPAMARHVFDVTGAGDTVVATFAAALGAKSSPINAAMLATLASGLVVAEVGTTVCTAEQLTEEINRWTPK
jgi:D-beta-D-heptose 7-phosphate kinase/D-beta-D-heptose 1-phosphate adenosyltransferase